MASDRPLIAVLNTNSRIMMPDEFARYGDRLQFRQPPAAARAADARNAVDAAMAKELLDGADGCITCWGSPPLSAELLAAAPNLRIIAHAAGTLRPYLSPAVWERDIAVVSAAGAIAEEVAQYTAALVVIGRRSLMELAPQTTQGKWRDARLHRPSSDVRGITVGIIGAGEVGRRVLALLAHYQVVARPFRRDGPEHQADQHRGNRDPQQQRQRGGDQVHGQPTASHGVRERAITAVRFHGFPYVVPQFRPRGALREYVVAEAPRRRGTPRCTRRRPPA